jgi:hypothetical protein
LAKGRDDPLNPITPGEPITPCKRSLEDTEQPSPANKRVKTNPGDIGPRIPPISISTSLPDKDVAELHKLNKDKERHHIVAAVLGDEDLKRRLGLHPETKLIVTKDLQGEANLSSKDKLLVTKDLQLEAKLSSNNTTNNTSGKSK